LKSIARKTAGKINCVELQKLFLSQVRRCVYSGIRLVLGDNASIDHKTPTSRGGGHEIENLQWVDIRINRMKGDMTDSEFRAFLAVIGKHMFAMYAA